MRKTAGITVFVVMVLITSFMFTGCGEIADATETATPSTDTTEQIDDGRLQIIGGGHITEVTGPLDTVAPTEELIPQSDYTYMPDSYASDICSYLNDKRKNNGDDSTDVEVLLDSAMCEEAKVHAMKMAKDGIGKMIQSIYCATGSDYASSDGKVAAESVFKPGSVFLDPIIDKIGVGAVKGLDGGIYLCVLGG